MKAKYTANWGVQVAGMIFQTRSSISINRKLQTSYLGRCGFGASAGCERKSKHSTRSDYKAAVKIGCLEFSSVYTKCCLIIGFNLFVNIPLKIPIKIPATSPERIKIGR